MSAAPPKKQGWKRLIKATEYSVAGLKAGWSVEESFRWNVVAALVLFPIGCYMGETGTEKVLLAVMPFLPSVVELLNSAIEAIVDRVGTDYHELSGRAKDLGSAAVMCTWFMVALTWIIILLT